MSFAEAYLQMWERVESPVSDNNTYVVNEKTEANVSGHWGAITTSPDALVKWSNDKSYAFIGSNYYRLNNATGAIDSGYPSAISSGWSDSFMHNGIDAALDYGNGNAYFFKGSEYIRMKMSDETTTNTSSIATGWPGMADAGFASGIDAAINYGNGKVYFFKGNQYVFRLTLPMTRLIRDTLYRLTVTGA